MNKEQKKEYNKNKTKEWRKNNPERNKELRKRYKESPNGKEANRKYDKKYREESRKRYKKNPEMFQQKKEYMNNYMKRYLEDKENYEKYLKRQKDYGKFRKLLLLIYGCCQECGSKENLEIHHLNYYEDSIENLTILCIKCHRRLHRKKKEESK